MTEKKGKILQSALTLFAENGYNATSTRQIAVDADVSEALIFRHFKNKEGLLEAVLGQGEEKAKRIYAEIIMEPDPKLLLKRTLMLPFSQPEEDFDFWRLQYKLKWELEVNTSEKMKPLLVALAHAFKELGYPEPDLEADYIIHLLDGLSAAQLKKTMQDAEAMQKFLLKKYDLS